MQHVTVGQEPARRRRKRLGPVLLATVAAAALTLSMNPAALAGGRYLWANHDTIGKRWIICADSLAVRHSKGGPAFAYLHKNQTFTVENPGPEEFGGEWVYGFAWGTVHSRGYVENGWFWPADGKPRCIKS